MPRKNDECWCEALKLVPRRWRAEFTKLVEEGEASDEFLAYLEADATCRRACEMLLRADTMMAELVKSTASAEDERSSRDVSWPASPDVTGASRTAG